MSITLHNYTCEGERFVQVETQPRHIAGVLSEIWKTIEKSDCNFKGIYSTYYESEEDSTITFYEGESAEAGNPGIWTYVTYDCDLGKEEVMTNLDVNTLAPVLKLRRIIDDVSAVSIIKNSSEQVQKLKDIAEENGLSSEVLLLLHYATIKSRSLIIRTERGLTIKGTRITLYDIQDYLLEGYPSKFIQGLFELTEEQINAAIDYIELNRAEVETGYQQVIRETEELRQYYAEQNCDRIAKIAQQKPKSGTEVAWEKLRAAKAKRTSIA